MKLSKKGLMRLLDAAFDGDEFYQSNALEVEFEPDDFTGAVILTVDEAKQVKVFLDDAIELHDKGIVLIQSTGFDTVQLIKDRIKQAEGKE